MDLFNQDHLGTATKSRIYQKTRGRDAGGHARHARGETMADLVAMVEQMAARRCSVNQILEAVRAFHEQAATIPAPSNLDQRHEPGMARMGNILAHDKGQDTTD